MKRSPLRLPWTAAYRNILFNGSSAAALYRLDTISYEFLSRTGKEQVHAQLAWFAYGVEADFSLYRVSRAYPADRYAQDTMGLADALDRRPPELWEAYLERQADHIARMHSTVTEVYLLVTLKQSRRRPWQRHGARHEGLALRDAEQHTFDTLTEHLAGRRATTMEAQWLLRRAAVRGVGEPELDANWMPPALTVDPAAAYEPRGASVTRHMATITEQERSLLVETDDGESFQAMLALGALPRTAQFPGGAEFLFTPLEALAFPVDVAMHVRWVSNEEMQKMVRNRVRDADNAWEDQAHNPQSWAPEEHRVAARDVNEYFTTEPYPPGLDTAISFAVGAASPDELTSRVAQLRRRFGAVRLYQPLGLQRELYEDHLPHPGPAIVTDYADLQIMEQFGAHMPIGTHGAGVTRGVYFAKTISGVPRPVKQDVTEASRTNRSPTVLLTGALGRGKTMAAQLMCYQAALRGSLVVDIDPGQGAPHNLEGLPGLEHLVHVIEVSGAEKNRGLLDPLVVAPEEMREDVASAYLMEILPQAPAAWSTQIRRAVKQVMLENDPSCMRVLDVLLKNTDENARLVGAELEVWADSGLGKLGFGDGTRAAERAALPVTTIKASGLSLPPPGTSRMDYDQLERLSVATHKLMVAYAMRLVRADRSVHKLLDVDEAHVFFGPGEGGRFLNRSVRMARSMNLTLLLSSQLLADVGELESLIGAKLAFGVETEDQARAVISSFGLDPNNDRLVKMLMGFTDGRCLIRGLDGRIDAVHVDVMDPEILAALDTNPSATPGVVTA